MPRRVLRVIGYPPLPEDYDTTKGLSCGAHTDYGCLTFLLADDFPGALQGKCDLPGQCWNRLFCLKA